MDRYRYLEILKEQIRAKRARPMVVKEVNAHIEDQKAAFLAEGMTSLEAEQAAVAQMGDPVEAGLALDRIHRPKMEWRVLAGILLLSSAGLAFQILVAAAAHPSGGGAGILSGLSGISRSYVAAMTAGILLMLAVCWMDYSFLGRYAVPLWILVNAAVVLSAAAGRRVNGTPLPLTWAVCLLVPFYAGLLYHFRGQGQKGLLKSVLCLCPSLVVMVYHSLISCLLVTAAAGFILLHAAIHKKWFGQAGRALYLKLWSGTVFLPLAGGAVWAVKSGGRMLAEYQSQRIHMWLHPGEYPECFSMSAAAASAAEQAKEGSALLTLNMMEEIRNSYLWVYLFRYLGTWKGILITGMVVLFWLYLFRVVHRQRNQLGYMVSFGCVLFLSLETLLYLAVNFRLAPPAAAYMPFLSNGGAFLLISYFYMGLLLSVCRNSELVKN